MITKYPLAVEQAWFSRWRSGDSPWQTGVARVQCVGAVVYILYQETGGGEYLLELRRVGPKLLFGCYMNLNHAEDSTPWGGSIVHHERIDGHWAVGRWDLRRRLL